MIVVVSGCGEVVVVVLVFSSGDGGNVGVAGGSEDL